MQKIKYEEEVSNLKAKVRSIDEKRWECIQLQEKIESEEDDKERMLFHAGRFNQEMEEDWRLRNMIGQKSYLFEEEAEVLQRIQAEHRMLREEKGEAFRKYENQLSEQEEEYQIELKRIYRRINNG